MKEPCFIKYNDDDERRLTLHAIEIAENSLDGEISTTAFLNLREQKLIETALLSDGSFCFAFFGGHVGSERRILVCFPDYAHDIAELVHGKNPSDSEKVLTACKDFAGDRLDLYRISGGSKFDRPLTHRDYLGALLALGIDRCNIGDIAVDDGCAYVFALSRLRTFISDNLTAVGRVPVKVEKLTLDDAVDLPSNTIELNCVVSSMRLDCVLSALTGVSREVSKSMISSGKCEHNYSVLLKPDDAVLPGDVISARGFGKYRISPQGTPAVTQKGKFRIAYFKYI